MAVRLWGVSSSMFRTYGWWVAQGDCCPRGGECRSSADGKGRKGATGTDGSRGEQGGTQGHDGGEGVDRNTWAVIGIEGCKVGRVGPMAASGAGGGVLAAQRVSREQAVTLVGQTGAVKSM